VEVWSRLGRQAVGRAAFLRLRGPLADDPVARIMHGLLVGLLAWSVLRCAIFLPRIVARPVVGLSLAGLGRLPNTENERLHVNR